MDTTEVESLTFQLHQFSGRRSQAKLNNSPVYTYDNGDLCTRQRLVKTMSLDVHVFRLNPKTGEEEFPEDLPYHNTCAGSENCRTLLYGAAVLRQLGLVLIPSLARANLWVRNEQLAELKAELGTMSQHIEQIAEQTRFETYYVAGNVRNISAAAQIAEDTGGGIVVW